MPYHTTAFSVLADYVSSQIALSQCYFCAQLYAGDNAAGVRALTGLNQDGRDAKIGSGSVG